MSMFKSSAPSLSEVDTGGNILGKEAHQNLASSIIKGSATSGELFRGIKFRKFNRNDLRFTDQKVKSSGLLEKKVESRLEDVQEHMDELYCNHWAVVTTIFEPSDAVIKQSKVHGWCLVVVGDRKGPKGYNVDGFSGLTNHIEDNGKDGAPDSSKRPNFIFLSPKDQEELADHLPIVKYLPWNHFGRKNVGYLYAILHGAQVIWDFDDDNGLISDAIDANMDFEGFRFQEVPADKASRGRSLADTDTDEKEEHLARHKAAFIRLKKSQEERGLREGASRRRLHKVVDSHELQSTCQVRQLPASLATSTPNRVPAFNPYPLMGAPSSPNWPRGYPLTLIKEQINTSPQMVISSLPKSKVAVVQSLANHDPDIDAIYRLTMPLPFDFPESSAEGQKKSEGRYPLMAPVDTYAPYNAQATLHLYSSLWSLLLPITVHGRVSDIWRGYFMQKICKAIDLHLLFAPPIVKQDRNDHDYLADFQSELPLYLRAPKLLEQLDGFSFTSTEGAYPAASSSLPGMIEHLWVEMYERGYIELQDVQLVQAWLESLVVVGYRFPNAP